MPSQIYQVVRAFLVSAVLLAALAYAAGPRTVFAYRELRCPPGTTAHPVSVAPVYQCRPPVTVPGVMSYPQVVVVEDRVALYLANLRVRVFDLDFAWGREHWLAWGVPPP